LIAPRGRAFDHYGRENPLMMNKSTWYILLAGAAYVVMWTLILKAQKIKRLEKG
jgi:hypothetical protein